MMLDDQLYGLVDLAYRLGIRLDDLYAMPLADVQIWTAFFARRASEREIAEKSRRRR